MMAEDKFEQAKGNIKKTIGNATNIEIWVCQTNFAL